ncbi:hypothetical protein EDB85DRAFT_1008099 [Lactarius pseudohatsudake]|nr:hypothetical protein EDB85DRAFT_1008099 [Lactarius pseudohatsudake]
MRLCRCHLSHISRPSCGISAVKDGNQRSMKWISPVVDVLYMFSGTLGGPGVAGLGFPEQGQSLPDNEDSPLHKMTCGKYWSQEDGVRVAWLLLERGMDVNRIRNDQCTPLHVAQAQFRRANANPRKKASMSHSYCQTRFVCERTRQGQMDTVIFVLDGYCWSMART